jgi:thiol-disulfide isomerase/thioredoxin
MKKHTYLMPMAWLLWGLLAFFPGSMEALTISGRITNAESNIIYLKSSWQRGDTLTLDQKGEFSVSINNSPYEKIFYLSWKAIDGYGRFLSLILEPTDIVWVSGDMKGEKIDYIQANLQRKNYLNVLMNKTSGTNHAKVVMTNQAEIDSANLEIFTYLDTLFQVDPILGIECLGFMRKTLFRDDYSWQQVSKVLKYIESVPADVKANLPIYPILLEALWPGQSMLELSFLDAEEKLHSTLEIEGKPMLILFGASWCVPCREKNEKFRSKNEFLQDKIQLLGISTERDYDRWKSYVEEKNYPWKQGLWMGDEFVNDEVLREKYHLYFIPLAVLIDQNRKIISFNPSIDEVLAFLNKK